MLPVHRNGDRYKDLQHPSTLSQLPDIGELVDSMRCSCCKKFPLYQLQPKRCLNGHLLCANCSTMGPKFEDCNTQIQNIVKESISMANAHEKKTVANFAAAAATQRGMCVRKCPVVVNHTPGTSSELCSNPLASDLFGSIQRLFYQASYFCPYGGCRAEYAGMELLEHLEKCEFQHATNCILTSCPVKDPIPLRRFLTHLLRTHKPFTVHSDVVRCRALLPSVFVKPGCAWITVLLKAFDRIFCLVIVEQEKRFFFVPYVISQDDSLNLDRYRCELKFGSDMKKPSYSAFNWCGMVNPVKRTFEEIIDSERYFTLRKNVILKNKGILIDGDWMIDVRIMQLQEHEVGQDPFDDDDDEAEVE